MAVDQKRETVKACGLRYVRYLGQRQHLLVNPEPMHHSPLEVWRTNRDAPGFGLIYKNSALQFERAIPDRPLSV